jgi:ATP-dependent Clp endopeptidase proteolytic subunit ClpP
MSKQWFKGFARGTVGEISILSDIGAPDGVTTQGVHQQLAVFKAQGVKTLHITISSDGGDTSVGFAIYSMLNRWPGRKVVVVEGLAASMASVIAMCGDEIVMASGSMMMIHNPWGGVQGGADQIKSFGDALNTIRQNIGLSYAKRTGIALDEIFKLMDRETWLSAEDAVRLKFADRVEGKLSMVAMANLPDISKFARAPAVPRGLDAVRQNAFERFNRKVGRTPGGTRVFIEKDGRRVLPNNP